MKILYIENRYQTHFWEEIARRLEGDGHDIHWIVQSHAFRPKIGSVNVIPYPRTADLRNFEANKTHLARVARKDRGINYFLGNSAHYRHYDECILEILRRTRPDVVFGESTEFHELICIEHCRALNIRYLQPTTTRYPAGRFAFYQYDTLQPFAGSRERMSDHAVDEIVDSIVGRSVLPDYMVKTRSPGNLQALSQKVRNRWTLTTEYFAGERFNTPHPVHKVRLQRHLVNNLQRWENLAGQRVPRADRFTLLYPLQMQPEANIDVWGNEHRCQATLLRRMLEATDGQTQILVKGNPKAKYEMSDDLMRLVESSDRLIPLPLATPMAKVFANASLIATVTGTVAIEAALAGKPVVTFADVPWTSNPGCIRLSSPEKVASAIEMVRSQVFPRNSADDNRRFIQWVVATSYPGLTTASFHNPRSADPVNLQRVHAGFSHVLHAIAEGEKQDSLAEIHSAGS